MKSLKQSDPIVSSHPSNHEFRVVDCKEQEGVSVGGGVPLFEFLTFRKVLIPSISCGLAFCFVTSRTLRGRDVVKPGRQAL